MDVQNELKSMPIVAISPPAKVVTRIPYLSVIIEEIGEQRNVVPVNPDPTKARQNERQIRKHFY